MAHMDPQPRRLVPTARRQAGVLTLWRSYSRTGSTPAIRATARHRGRLGPRGPSRSRLPVATFRERGSPTGFVVVARFFGSLMNTWSVSAISKYCSVRAAGSRSKNCVIACGRFITGKPMSHVFSPVVLHALPPSSCLTATVGISLCRASGTSGVVEDSSLVNPVISVHGFSR